MVVGTYQKITYHYGYGTAFVANQVDRFSSTIAEDIKKAIRAYNNKDNLIKYRTWGPDAGDRIYHVEVFDGEHDEENMEISYKLYLTIEVNGHAGWTPEDWRAWLRSIILMNTPKKLSVSYNIDDYYLGVY